MKDEKVVKMLKDIVLSKAKRKLDAEEIVREDQRDHVENIETKDEKDCGKLVLKDCL
jgi:hypothetical protein